MSEDPARLARTGWRAWTRWSGIVLLAFLAVHSLSYGGGFLGDPATGAGEYGDSNPTTEAAENLAGLVGVVLLLVSAIAATAGALLVRRRRAGAWLTSGLGVALVTVGAYWFTRGVPWDAGFYGSVGSLLLGSGAIGLWPPRQP